VIDKNTELLYEFAAGIKPRSQACLGAHTLKLCLILN